MIAWLASVRGRVTLGVTILFAVGMGFGGWFLLDRAEAAWVDDLQAQDLAELELLAANLQAFEDRVRGGVLPVGAGGTSFTLIDPSGALVASTPIEVFGGGVNLQGEIPAGEVIVSEADALPEAISGLSGFGSVAVAGEVVTVSLPVEMTQGEFTLSSSSSLEPVQAGVDALRGILWLLVPLLIAAVGAVTWLVTGRAFRPVAAITGQVERITDDRLDERVPVPASRDEVAHLARTMNTMLERLGASRRRQRQFVSDASHELRNPVATSKVKLEVALAHPGRTDWEETARVVLEEQERLGGLIDDLLLLARLDEGRPPDDDAVDLDDIVFAEAGRSHPAHIDASAVEAVRVRGDGRQLSQLVGNIIDNAARHATREVVVSLTQEGGDAVLAVQDDGPGIPEPDRQRVFERFVRLEDARTRDAGGVGLGLALVDAVATAHGATVSVSEAPCGGARFEVRLPVAQ